MNAVCEHMYVAFFDGRPDWLDVAEHPARKGQHRRPDDATLLSPQGPRLAAQSAAVAAYGLVDKQDDQKCEAKLRLLLRALGMASQGAQFDKEGLTIEDIRGMDAITFRAFLPGVSAHAAFRILRAVANDDTLGAALAAALAMSPHGKQGYMEPAQSSSPAAAHAGSQHMRRSQKAQGLVASAASSKHQFRYPAVHIRFICFVMFVDDRSYALLSSCGFVWRSCFFGSSVSPHVAHTDVLFDFQLLLLLLLLLHWLRRLCAA